MVILRCSITQSVMLLTRTLDFSFCHGDAEWFELNEFSLHASNDREYSSYTERKRLAPPSSS